MSTTANERDAGPARASPGHGREPPAVVVGRRFPRARCEGTSEKARVSEERPLGTWTKALVGLGVTICLALILAVAGALSQRLRWSGLRDAEELSTSAGLVHKSLVAFPGAVTAAETATTRLAVLEDGRTVRGSSKYDGTILWESNAVTATYPCIVSMASESAVVTDLGVDTVNGELVVYAAIGRATLRLEPATGRVHFWSGD